MISKLILFLLDIEIKRIRKTQDTPYMYIKGTGKDYPKYVMYTDDKEIAKKMHTIY